MTKDQLYFITYCVGNLSKSTGRSAQYIYNALRTSRLLDEYIIPCYDVLHSFSKDYIVNDLTEALKEKGVLV